ncbi:MAG: response regulator [Thiovulaceae bacterium]|nr:response regulator [Sulfurimonadaceae bacterium]
MDGVNQLLTTYAGEAIAIITGVFILLLIVIFKQKKDHPKDLMVHEQTNVSKTRHSAQAEQTKNPVKSEELKKENLAIETTESVKTSQPSQMIIPKRRELALHGAITKDSFKIFAGSKLLIAEDNIINQKVINGMLGDSGIDIIMADNGQEALDILKYDKSIYIVLMDAHMPIVDGFEATKRIRADKSLDHLLVVALSGDTAVDDIKKMKNSGMQEYLEKPLKVEKLYDILYCYIDIINDQESASAAVDEKALLHINEGIEICGGDVKLYKEILLECLSMYQDANQNIKSLMLKEDTDAIKKLLLDISGISANIGADKLSEIATKFREILNHDLREQFFTIEEEFTNNLSTLINEIKSYLH